MPQGQCYFPHLKNLMMPELQGVKGSECCYGEQVVEHRFKSPYPDLELMLLTTPSSGWTEMTQG